MLKPRSIFLSLVYLFICSSMQAQQPSTRLDSIYNVLFGGHDTDDLTFTGTRLIGRDDDAPGQGKLTLSGYVDAYYALYTDTAGAGGFHKFPTVAPQSNVFSLNIAQLSMKYDAEKSRATVTLHYGDIPNSAWSPGYNPIQEANAGIRLRPKLWLDAGFFRTHIGLESIQPRENINTSIAATTYFEPYFLSGAKLTWYAGEKLALQVNAFNSFNTFTENNAGKAVGISAVYDPSEALSLTFNSLLSDDYPAGTATTHYRLYNNLYLVYKRGRHTVGAEANFGVQQHTSLVGANSTALMASSLLAYKYRLLDWMNISLRGEYFFDPDEILTGPLENANHQLVGLNLYGLTAGMEFKPVSNAYLRLEGRRLHTTPDETIFYHNGSAENQRYEFIASTGVWF